MVIHICYIMGVINKMISGIPQAGKSVFVVTGIVGIIFICLIIFQQVKANDVGVQFRDIAIWADSFLINGYKQKKLDSEYKDDLIQIVDLLTNIENKTISEKLGEIQSTITIKFMKLNNQDQVLTILYAKKHLYISYVFKTTKGQFHRRIKMSDLDYKKLLFLIDKLSKD